MILWPIFTAEDAERTRSVALKLVVAAFRWPGAVVVLLGGLFVGSSTFWRSPRNRHTTL